MNTKSILFNETHKNIYSMLKMYGCMTVKTIIQRYLEDFGEVLIDNQVQDFIFYNRQYLTLETVKTKRARKFLIGRKDMMGV